MKFNRKLCDIAIKRAMEFFEIGPKVKTHYKGKSILGVASRNPICRFLDLAA